jgi:small ligand-binding sensory domain FIST
MKNLRYDRITTTIEREWLAQIIAGTKKIEYRQIKPYWTKRFATVSMPFELRLLNGMNPPVPEVTVLIHRITKDRRGGDQELQRRMSEWDSGFHGTKLLTMRSQSAVWPTAADMKDAITIPA